MRFPKAFDNDSSWENKVGFRFKIKRGVCVIYVSAEWSKISVLQKGLKNWKVIAICGYMKIRPVVVSGVVEGGRKGWMLGACSDKKKTWGRLKCLACCYLRRVRPNIRCLQFLQSSTVVTLQMCTGLNLLRN